MTGAPYTESQRRDNNFTFLRLILATLVIFTHTYTWVFGSLGTPTDILSRVTGNQLSFSGLAVGCFFTISGYLLTESWLRKPSALGFLKRRIARIYPGFVVESLVCGLLIHPLTVGWSLYYSVVSVPKVLIYLPLLQYHAPITVLPQFHLQLPFNGTIWTLELEFTCYLLLLVLGATTLLRHRFVVLALFLLSAAAYLLQLAGHLRTENLANEYLLPHPESLAQLTMFFLAGSCACLFRDAYRFTPIGTAVAAAIVVLSLTYPPLIHPVVAVAGTYLLLNFTHAKIPAIDWFKSAPDISYGTYMYGWPVQFSLAFLYPNLSFWPHFALTCLCAYSCGFISWHLVEKHFARGQRLRSRSDSALRV